MKVVLRTDVPGVGKRGDITDVSDGFARNYLVPQGRAIAASAGIEDQAASMRRSRDLKDARNREGAEAIARKLVPIVFRIEARSGSEGRLFGSVTSSDIVDAVNRQSGIELDRRRLVIDEVIKTLGVPRGRGAPPPGGRVPLDFGGRQLELRRVRPAAVLQPLVRMGPWSSTRSFLASAAVHRLLPAAPPTRGVSDLSTLHAQDLPGILGVIHKILP